jgi:hypothetical protein
MGPQKPLNDKYLITLVPPRAENLLESRAVADWERKIDARAVVRDD